MKPKRNVWLMFAIALLQGMVFYGPIATLYRQAAGVTVFQITIIESICLILCLLLELPWGIVADRIGYKKTMLFCCCLYFVSKIVFWQAASFGAFLVERILLSIVISGISGVDSSILYLSCEKDKVQQVFGRYNSLFTVGLLIASVVYSLGIRSNFRLAGLLTVGSYGVAMLLSFWLIEVKAPEKERSTQRSGQFFRLLKEIGKNKALIFLLLGIALLNETHQTITVFLNQLQYVKCGLTDATIGYVYIGITLVGLLGVFSHKLTRWLGALRLTTILYGGAVVACVVLGITLNAWLSIAAIAILRLSFSLFQPLQMDLQNRHVLTENRATELSVNAVIVNCVGVATNLVYGKLAETHLSYAMFTGAILCFTGLIFLLMWFWKERKRGGEECSAGM